MTRRNAPHLAFDALAIEGSLLPADWLAKVATLEAPHQSSSDYGVPKGLNLRDELGRYWRIASAHWNEFQIARGQPHSAEVATRKFITALLSEVFGAADLSLAESPQILDERSYPVTAFAISHRLPVVIAPHDITLDIRHQNFGDSGRQRSAFGLLQDYLNAADDSLWGIVSNGKTIRLARDNASLTRPAWIEADLERIFIEDRFADFSLLWLITHTSRFGQQNSASHECALEAWRNDSREQGTRAREYLRIGVEEALLAFGQGFLSHPENDAIRQRLANGSLTPTAYFQQLLRLVYRLIFLLTIEERDLLHPPGASSEATELYGNGYSLRRLRERARRLRAYDRHHDLWQGLKPVFGGLAKGEDTLGLPALGGLFAADQCPDLDAAYLGNSSLLKSVFRLAWLRVEGSLARINWRDMGPEELGSVYESLLELVPDISSDGRVFGFAGADQSKGNTRKTSGSYYTPDVLVQELLDSALEPVIAQRLAAAIDPQAELLAITVCDPACGSGHFLLAAARRLANHLARLRAQGTPSGDDYRHALRDVITHCIFGVDLNPMALELARMSLWLEAMTPDRPLGFLDHHLQCGDALLGVLDAEILDQGLPDSAFLALTGDDKSIASAYRKQNKSERDSWKKALTAGDLFRGEQLALKTAAVEQLADDSINDVAAKRAAWREAETAAHDSRLARLADLFVGAFLLAKTPATSHHIPSSRHLWALANSQSTEGLDAVEIAARSACEDSRVFHWWLGFPHISAQGGFSVMLGNPPWERIKLQEEEFFSARSPMIAKAQNKSERGKRIELLRAGRLQQTIDGEDFNEFSPNIFEQELHRAFESAKRSAEAASAFIHSGDISNVGRYPLTGVGDVNTYALFAETFLQLLHPTGRAGFIVPSGIGTDDSTKRYFQEVSQSGRLVSFTGFDNEKRLFQAVHPDTPFSLVTIGRTSEPARLRHYVLTMDHLDDARREFTLTPAEFALINPNTRTCPVFRSQQDAELTKKLYRRFPVLIREQEQNALGEVVEPEINPWGITFQRMFDMSNDSELFVTSLQKNQKSMLPLYEAKMIHQYDHRWATYVDAHGSKDGVETLDVSDLQKDDASFSVRPRYWVEEREVFARISRVPRAVSKAWLADHKAVGVVESQKANMALQLALSQWVAGELFRRHAGPLVDNVYSSSQRLKAYQLVERLLFDEYPSCAGILQEVGITGKNAVTAYAKWAVQDTETPLTDDELATLSLQAKLRRDRADHVQLRDMLDDWIARRSPSWLIGYRRTTNATNERTCLVSVLPRAAAGDSIFLIAPTGYSSAQIAALLGCLSSLVFDYACRQKVGGLNFNFYLMKQLPVPTPTAFTESDLTFIVPRILELTYTSRDLRDWAADIGYRGAPFKWDQSRRAQIRAELDAYYARQYGVDRDELRYILDPASVLGDDYPSETFRVLKNSEIRQYGEFRTARMVLHEFDRLSLADATGKVYESLLVPPPGALAAAVYSTQGIIQSQAEAMYASLVLLLIQAATPRLSRIDLSNALTWLKSPILAQAKLSANSSARFAMLLDSMPDVATVDLGSRFTDLLESLERDSIIRVEQQGSSFTAVLGAVAPDWLSADSSLVELANLLIEAINHVQSTSAVDDVDSSTRLGNG